jgi:type IV pilus assembly protein PilA
MQIIRGRKAGSTNKAFTLIELIVVIVIIGILAAIAVVSFNTVIGGSEENVAESSAETVARNANAIAAIDNEATVYADITTAVSEGNVTGARKGVTDCFDVTNGGGTASVAISGGLAVASADACP